jgi:hypothetical protein
MKILICEQCDLVNHPEEWRLDDIKISNLPWPMEVIWKANFVGIFTGDSIFVIKNRNSRIREHIDYKNFFGDII